MKANVKCLFFSDSDSKENALVLGSGSGKHADHDMIQDLGFFFLFVRNNQQALQKRKYKKNLELSQQRPSRVKWGQWKVSSE